MKLLHCGDIHISELPGPVVNGKNARMLDTINCMNFLADTAEAERPDAILIAGDLFHKSKMWADPMMEQIAIAAEWLRRLAQISPTVLLFGTESHDNPLAFENIRAMKIKNLYIITSPELFTITTKSGPFQVAGVPGFDKGYFRAKNPGMDPTEENAICSKLLGDIVLGLGTQIDPAIPSVLMAHYTTAGAEYDNGQMSIFNNSEVTLPREALAASPFDIVCLGHIHKAQEVHCGNKPVFYSGALNGLTFNEEGQAKGFWIHELESPWCAPGVDGLDADGSYGGLNSRFIHTPYRGFITLDVDFRNDVDLQAAIKWELAGIGDNPENTLLSFPTTGKIVRLHYQCTEEQEKQISRKEMEKLLYTGGAFYVSEIKPVQVTTALTKQEMSENAGPLENLRSWCRAEGFTPEDTLSLEILARPMIDLVSAKMPTGKLSGVFVPKRIEVRNYRSYREESFDFFPIVFATVNGSNGVGKSALFMDALCDCLYEEPREGDLTGWISNDPAVKSGAITFDFGMGDTDWRVARTRVKSGKTTLALMEKVDGEWVDRSEPKKDDTQAKIISLLGMDAMTFKCCGLIMQDAYGLFLEADKADRMEVMGSILGLGIYEQLTELAKVRATETKWGITAAKEKLADLDEKLKAVIETQTIWEETDREIEQTGKDITAKETELAATEELIRTLQTKTERAAGLQQQLYQNAREIEGLKTEKAAQQGKIDTAQKKLDVEEQILQKAAEYEQVKQLVAVLQAKSPRLKELGAEENRLQEEITRTDGALRRLVPQIREVEDLLKDRAELEKAAGEYRAAIRADESLNELAERDNLLRNKVMEIERITDRSCDAINRDISHLNTLKDRTAMPLNSGCLDPENASCSFLADAQNCKKQIPELEESIERQEKERKTLLEQVSALEKEREVLGYCNSQRHYEVREKIKTLRPKAEKAAQLEAKAQLWNSLLEQRKQHEEQKNSLTGQLDNIREESKSLATELEPLSGLEQRLPKLKLWVDAKDELPACREIVKAAQERTAAIDREIAGKEEQAKTLDEERKELVNSASQLEQHKWMVDTLKEEIRRQQGYKNALHAKVGSLQAKLDSLKKDREERDRIAEEMEPTAKLLVQYQTLSKAFSMDGIPFSIVRAVVPELSAMANDILADMTGGKMSLEIKLDKVQKSNKKEVNALEIWINDYQRGSLPYKSRSGGQKVKSALSVAFALADLKARRAGIQLGMLFVDEPSFLDQEGTEAYVDALMSMSQKRYGEMTVIAISHDPRLKARFPQIIEVVDMGDEGSKVRMIA